MASVERKLFKSGPYNLLRQRNTKMNETFFLVSINKDAWVKCKTSQAIINDHFNAGIRDGILCWRFRNKEEPAELISLAILKGLI